MYLIEPVQKRYAWGSHTKLQDIFGLEQGSPLAEMWFSGHVESPSNLVISGIADNADSSDKAEKKPVNKNLAGMISENPTKMLGSAVSAAFGPVLPYLFKVISARMPLSLQVHPLDFEARAGFNRENREGIALNAPERTFKDSLAKHEMVVALEPFEACVGFMSRPLQLQALRAIDNITAQRMRAALSGAGSLSRAGGMFNDDMRDEDMPESSAVWTRTQKRIFRAFRIAVTACGNSDDMNDIRSLPAALERALNKSLQRRVREALESVLTAAKAFPDDPSVLCLAMMNHVTLEEGESVFIPAGTPHAYLSGTAAEIMTNSDNVLRGGMTVKHKDIPNLLRNINCRPEAPIDPSSGFLSAIIHPNFITYRPNLREYMLAYGFVRKKYDFSAEDLFFPQSRSVLKKMSSSPDFERILSASSKQKIPVAAGPRILLCVSGSICCQSSGGRYGKYGNAAQTEVIGQGQALFILADEEVYISAANNAVKNASGGSYLLAGTAL